MCTKRQWINILYLIQKIGMQCESSEHVVYSREILASKQHEQIGTYPDRFQQIPMHKGMSYRRDL